MSEAISNLQPAREPVLDLSGEPLATLDVSNPRLFEQDTWGKVFARLRKEDPVHYCANSRFGA